jgi:diketogulonate reductase-like aldo/keto reductase
MESTMATFKGPVFKLNNGIEMPGFGFGVFRSEPQQTVDAYMNEQQVGEGVRASGIPREDIFVTTKVWMTDYGYDQTLHAFDKSLRKLGFDYLDLYLTHWPVPSAFDETIASYKAAMKLLEEGRVRAIGVCNFSSGHLRNLIEQTGHIPAVNQIEVHPFFTQSELREADEKLGIITQAWSPIGGIKRDGEKAKVSGKVVDPLSHPSVVRLATKYGKSPAQIILRWQIQIGTCPIPKSVRQERIAENIDIFSFALAVDEVQAISALDTGERGGPDPELVSPKTFPLTTHD